MTLWIFWIAMAAILLIVEVATQMVWTLCLAIGCLAALAADRLGAELPWQLIVLAAVAVVAYIILVPYVKKWHERQVAREGAVARTGMDALLGRRAVVTEEIRPGEKGRARIDGDTWQVVVPGAAAAIAPGREVVVTGYDSIVLTAAMPEP